MAAPSARLLTDAVISALAGTGFQIGDAAAPKNAVFPYAVVYPIGDLDRTGPISDGQTDTLAEIQVTSVGETREQATGLADRVRSTLTPGSLTVSGRSIQLVDLIDGTSVERDDDVQPPVFYAIDTFGIWSTPS